MDPMFKPKLILGVTLVILLVIGVGGYLYNLVDWLPFTLNSTDVGWWDKYAEFTVVDNKLPVIVNDVSNSIDTITVHFTQGGGASSPSGFNSWEDYLHYHGIPIISVERLINCEIITCPVPVVFTVHESFGERLIELVVLAK